MANTVRQFAIELLQTLTVWAMETNHTVGDDDDYYITLTEVDAVIKRLLEKYDR